CGRQPNGCSRPSECQSPLARAKAWPRARDLSRPQPISLSSWLRVVCPAYLGWSEPQLTRGAARTNTTCLISSWNHSAFEHFVGDGSGYLADEGRAHLRIGFQHLEGSLLHWGFRLLTF